jgi:ribosomal protein S6
MMRKYELVVIVDALLGKEEKDAIMKKATDAIAKSGGKVINNQVWLARQKFAFKIKRRTEGTYYVLNIDADPSSVLKIRQALVLVEEVLRFEVIKID